MKKITLILAVALFAIACNNETDEPTTQPQTYDVTFEVRFVIDNAETLFYFGTVGVFENLDFDLEASIQTFQGQPQRMATRLNGSLISVESKHSYNWVHSSFDGVIIDPVIRFTIYDIEPGDYFIAVLAANFFAPPAGRLFGYRRITVNNQTAREVQRFIFSENDPPNIFLEK